MNKLLIIKGDDMDNVQKLLQELSEKKSEFRFDPYSSYGKYQIYNVLTDSETCSKLHFELFNNQGYMPLLQNSTLGYGDLIDHWDEILDNGWLESEDLEEFDDLFAQYMSNNDIYEQISEKYKNLIDNLLLEALKKQSLVYIQIDE